jgi:nucleotide-binding universal stress UspA family protein
VNTILLATDGSPSAREATDEAIELAVATGWPLRVLAVWRTPSVAGYGYAPMTLLPELAEVEREHAVDVAETAVEHALEAGAVASYEVREGDAADEICAVAAELPAKLIVVGAHGWSAFKRLLFGSVSTRVLHEAPCAVIVAPAHDGEHVARLDRHVATAAH